MARSPFPNPNLQFAGAIAQGAQSFMQSYQNAQNMAYKRQQDAAELEMKKKMYDLQMRKLEQELEPIKVDADVYSTIRAGVMGGFLPEGADEKYALEAIKKAETPTQRAAIRQYFEGSQRLKQRGLGANDLKLSKGAMGLLEKDLGYQTAMEGQIVRRDIETERRQTDREIRAEDRAAKSQALADELRDKLYDREFKREEGQKERDAKAESAQSEREFKLELEEGRRSFMLELQKLKNKSGRAANVKDPLGDLLTKQALKAYEASSAAKTKAPTGFSIEMKSAKEKRIAEADAELAEIMNAVRTHYGKKPQASGSGGTKTQATPKAQSPAAPLVTQAARNRPVKRLSDGSIGYVSPEKYDAAIKSGQFEAVEE